MTTVNHAAKKFSDKQLNAIRKHLIIPNWKDIADDHNGTKCITYEKTDTQWGTTYTTRVLFVDHPGNDYHGMNKFVTEKFPEFFARDANDHYGRRRVDSFSIRDGFTWSEPLKGLVDHTIDKLGRDKFNLLYEESKIDEKLAKNKATYEASKEKRLEARAAKFTIPGQKQIARHAVMLIINDMLQKEGLPFRLSADIRGMRDKVLFHVKPTGDAEVIKGFNDFFKPKEYNYWANKNKKDEEEEKADDSGRSLHDALERAGFDMDHLLKLMMTDATSEHVRQFGAVFGQQLALGALDKSTLVRKAAKLQMKKKKEDEEAAKPWKKAEDQETETEEPTDDETE